MLLLSDCSADAQEEARKLRAELTSAQLDTAETDALVERARKLEAANKQLKEQLGTAVRTVGLGSYFRCVLITREAAGRRCWDGAGADGAMWRCAGSERECGGGTPWPPLARREAL